MKQIAADMGLSVPMLYKWAQPADESGTVNPLDRVEALMSATEDPRIVHWICEHSGGFFMRNPKTDRNHRPELVPATNEVVQEFADLLGEIAKAASDHHISPEESKNIRARWEELKSVTEKFVHCCEQSDFSAVR